MHQPLKTFIIYAREDSATLVELKKSLNPFERKGQIDVWYDGEIIAGQEWEKAIKTQIETADIILLLLSSDFFDSEYIQKRELREALARHERGESVVIPIIVRHCLWQEHPEIEKLQVLPDNAMPITSKKHWDSPDEAFTNVAAGIARTVRRIHDQREAANATGLAYKQRLAAEVERAETKRQADARALENEVKNASQTAKSELLDGIRTLREGVQLAKLEADRREQAEKQHLAQAVARLSENEAKHLQQEQEAAHRAAQLRYAGIAVILVALVVAGYFFKQYMDKPTDTQSQVIENQFDTTQMASRQKPNLNSNTQKEPGKTDPQYTPPAPILGPGPRKSGLTMVQVPGGTFQMGSNDGEADEKPVHAVTLSAFKIGKYEVTQADWRDIMDNNPSDFKNCDLCPVENISWYDAQDFLKKLNARYPGKNYRLPTEAEWEYAARGGNQSKGYKYSGSGKIGLVAWYDGNSGRKTHPVGERKANELGIYDMSGNVWEWCADRKSTYPSLMQTNPQGGKIDEYRVFRGGSWFGSDIHTVYTRMGNSPGMQGNDLGIRLVSN